MSFCVLCGRELEDYTCDRCECMLDDAIHAETSALHTALTGHDDHEPVMTWDSLPYQEQLALVSFDHTPKQWSEDEPLTTRGKLFLKGILQKTTDDMRNDRYYSLTPLGESVLAQATPQPVPAPATEQGGAGEAEEIEAALWAGAELMGNVSDDGYEKAVKAKATFANYRSRAIAMQQSFNDIQLEYANELQSELDTYDKIWSAVTADKIGKWDYPAQVVRHVEHMRDDYAQLRAQLQAEKNDMQSAAESLHSQYLTEKDRYQALYRDYMELHDMHESDTSFVIETHERLFGVHPVNNEDGSSITFDETVEHWERETIALRAALKAATDGLAAAEKANGVLREALEVTAKNWDIMMDAYHELEKPIPQEWDWVMETATTALKATATPNADGGEV